MRSSSTARRLIVLIAALAAIGVGVHAAPAPEGHDLILRGLIQDAAIGRIQYATLTPELAAAMRLQAANAQSELAALGALQSVTFERVAADGGERYRTAFEHGALDWAFAVDAQGRITNARYRPASPPAN